MKYRIVYLDSNVLGPEGGAPAIADKVERIVQSHAEQGWNFAGLQQAQTTVTNPGNNGCFGLGAVPTTQSSIAVNLLVFEAP